MKKINYPKKFYDFSTGCEIKKTEINKWIKEGIKTIKQSIKQGEEYPFVIQQCGNTTVMIVVRERIKTKYELNIIVAKNYQQYSTRVKF